MIMARDRGLEQTLAEDLSDLPDLVARPMFGGLCWMHQGHLLCCASSAGVLARIGKDNAGWTEGIAEIAPMVMGGRAMPGWVRLSPNAAGDDALRGRLIEAARRFVATLPPK